MKISLSAVLLAAAFAAPNAFAQNLLANPSFENGGLAGWTFFGPNVTAETTNPPEIVPRTGNSVCKLFGDFSGTFNVSGIFQAFPASPGQSFTMDCWTRHWSGDPMTGLGAPNDNWVVMKLAFFDASHNEVGNAESIVLDGNSVQDAWIDNAPITGVAPVGTTSVEAFILFLQPGLQSGAAQVDDLELYGPPTMPAYPGTGEDLVLSSAVGGSFLSTGPGTDIKTAAGGTALEFNVGSPTGTFDQQAYYLVGQLFPTGAPPVPQPAFPSLWFNFNTFFVLVSGAPTQIGPRVIGPGTGSSTFYRAPMGFAGLSVMVQGLVITPTAANTLFAATDAHEIQFQ